MAFVLIKLPFIWNVVKKLFGALSPFIYGFVMAYLLMPVFNMLYRRIQPPMSRKFAHGTRIAKGISSLLTLIIGLAVVAGLALDGAAAAPSSAFFHRRVSGYLYERRVELGDGTF